MTPRITPLARAIHLAFATGLTLGSLAVTHAALAQPAASSIIRFDIEAAPLDQALSQFGRQAGIPLSIDASLTAGKASPGVKGSFSVEQGFAQLLAGTGLSVFRTDSGNYLLAQAAEASGALELGATSINSRLLGETTEGTGSYTTGVTSTATKMNLSLKETPQTITVITRQRMDDQHLTSMTDVLRQTPGITMTQDGGERYNIYSRGSAMNTYQFDGVTTTQENITRNMPSTLLDMALYDRVEIVRGATGLMTGAGDPSGVINLIRKKPTHTFKSYVQANAGSWDNYRGEADVSGPLNEAANVRGRLVAAKQDNHTYMDWYDQKREIFYGVVEADVTDTTLVRFGIDNQKYKATGAPGAPLLFTDGQAAHYSRSTSSGARWGYEKFDTTNYTATLEQALANDWQLRVVTNYMKIKRDTDNTTLDSSSGRSWLRPDGIGSAERAYVKADQIQKGLDINVQGPFQLFGRTHELIAGYNYSDYRNQHWGVSGVIAAFDYNNWKNQIDKVPLTSVMDFDITSRQSGYFVASRFNLTDELHFILGARVSNYHYDYDLVYSTGYVSQYQIQESGVVTPYAGLIYDITPEQSVYASYTDIFKPNSAEDRNRKTLDPQVGANYEMGWKGEFLDGRLNTSAAIYFIKRDNVPEEDPEPVIDNPSRPDVKRTAYVAVSGAETKGIDLEMAGEILPGWSAQVGYSHTRTEDAEGHRITTQLPMDTFRFWTTYRLPGDWQRMTVGGGVDWNSSSSIAYTNYSSTIRQDDYAVANLMARYQVNDHLSTTLNVANLFDEKYYSGMGGSYGHYGAPRNANVSVRYDF
ncbi:TonB-dependent siderophore receptor [Pseudomonas monteilii]|uniref:TonB-dependent siderophore receptor n=1 Tax=Pseudomonas monteilii TaxID=76759 RepID=UPI00381BDF8E